MMAAGNNGVMTSNNNNVIASAVSSVSANLLRKHIADQGLDLPLQSFLKGRFFYFKTIVALQLNFLIVSPIGIASNFH